MPFKSQWTQLRKPIKDLPIEFGKYKGSGITWGEVERSYIELLLNSKREEVAAMEDELLRRDLLEEAELPMAEKLLRAGYHALAQQLHPDKGGSEKAMRELNAAHEGLKELLAMQRGTP